MKSMIRKLIDQRVTMRSGTVAGMVALQVLLTIACAFALKQNVMLSDRAELYRRLTGPVVGRDVPTITGLDRAGVRRSIEYNRDHRPTLIYSFIKDCGACQANWGAMKSIQQLSPGRLRIIYVDDADDLADAYLVEHGLTQDVLFRKLDPFSELSYQVRATPQAELVDKAGRVMWTHVGSFRPQDVAALIGAIERHEAQSLEVNKGVGQ